MSEQVSKPRTVLVAAFEGWNDAAQCSTSAAMHLVSQYESREVRHIRRDGFYDYQAARPMLCNVQGRRRILWPQTTFYDVTVLDDLHLLVQIAPEPNYRWEDYCRISLRFAEEFEVDEIVTMGSMFANCPHTRPLPLDVTDCMCQCDLDREYSGPVGIPTVLDVMACEEGYTTATMWVSVPQYLDADECPAGALRLLRGLGTVLGVTLDEGDLEQKAAQWKERADLLTHCSDDLMQFVHHMEHDYDLREKAERIAALGAPACEQLVKEAEEFLHGFGKGDVTA